jgi:hypothetical protein
MQQDLNYITPHFLADYDKDVTEMKNRYFEGTVKLCYRLNRRGAFKKPWIIIPLNLGGDHWIAVALLNIQHLGQAQEEKFSGFLVYDSYLYGNPSYLQDMTTLQAKGILNLIVCANKFYGRPRILDENISVLMMDPTRFAHITIPEEDYVGQQDQHNCGVFAMLAMIEMSLVHCFHYLSKADFIQKEIGPGDVSFQLKPREWFKLYKNDNGNINEKLCSAFRHQTTCLWNRILTRKSKKNISPRKPTHHHHQPNYIRENF